MSNELTRRLTSEFRRDPACVIDLPLYKLDGDSFMSRDAYGHLCAVTGALWTPRGRSLDGADDRSVVGNNSILNPTRITVEVWVNPAAIGGDIHFVNKWSAGDQGYIVSCRGDLAPGKLNVGIYTTSAREYQENGSSIVANQANHLAMTYDGATLLGYVNCIPVVNRAVGGAIASSNCDIWIGGAASWPRWTTGIIGEVRVYNRALTPTEIQQNYLATKWRYQ